MDWSKGYSSSYYLAILDKATLRDIDRTEIINGTIKRSLTDLREGADLSVKTIGSEEHYVRVWFDARQDSEIVHTPLFTGLAIAPKTSYEGGRTVGSLECYSMLKIARDVLLPRGWYAPVEIDGGKILRDLLSVVGVPIYISDNAPALSQSVIAESNENHLSMADKILDIMNWRMRLDGMGSIYIEPVSNDEVAMFDANDNDIIENKIDIAYDWYNAPNVLRCVLDDSYVEVRDDDPDSLFSTVTRGREVWYEDDDVNLNLNETLAEYAQRMIKEYQKASTDISYDRRFYPDVYPGDVIRLGYAAQGVTGLYLITDQSISLGYNAKTSEEVLKL